MFSRLLKASDKFELGDIPAPGFPIVMSAEGQVSEEAHRFLRELKVMGARSTGTLSDIAGILCTWFNFLSERGVVWDQAGSGDFIAWAKVQGPARPLGTARQSRRANVVFDFYEFLDRCGFGGEAVGYLVRELAAPIDPHVFQEGMPVVRRLRMVFDRPSQRQRAMRPTPNAEQAEAVFQSLLGDGDKYNSIRNWLIAQVALETNLRVQGLSSLNVHHIDTMLIAKGIVLKGETIEHLRDPSRRVQIRSAISSLERNMYRNLSCHGIREKGKIRSVEFPTFLIRKLLEYVWEEREVQICSGPSRAKRSQAAGALWLSTKTGRALARGSIADILKQGFVDAGVGGSGHRLRAAHAVRLLRRFVSEARINGGNRPDSEAILDRVADRMGQSDPSSLRPYLNAVMLEDLLIADMSD
jgi:integrase